MRITVLTWGTRGDVQPYAAIARGLELEGHRVVLGVNENHVSWARRTGLAVASLPLDFHALMTSERARSWLTSGDTGHFLAALAEGEHEQRHAIVDALLEACAGADAVVSGLLVDHRAAAIAEANGVAFVRAFIYPVAPTSSYASPFLGNCVPDLPREVLRLRSHAKARSILLRTQRADLDEMRKRLALPALEGTAEDHLDRRGVRSVHLYDERVLPRPHDWPDHLLVSGYCPLQHEIRARLGEVDVEGLDAWLDAGPAPIFFGFGSIPVVDPPQLLHTIGALCRALDVRALVCAGWSDLADGATDEVRVIGAVNHDTVFPRCLAAVHHGGARHDRGKPLGWNSDGGLLRLR